MPQELNDILATYVDSKKKFSDAAKTFLEHVTLLNQARVEYQKAAKASEEMRSLLDAGDETLRTLMAQVEKASSDPFSEAFIDREKMEMMLEPQNDARKERGARSAVAKAFP